MLQCACNRSRLPELNYLSSGYFASVICDCSAEYVIIMALKELLLVCFPVVNNAYSCCIIHNAPPVGYEDIIGCSIDPNAIRTQNLTDLVLLCITPEI